MVKRLKLATRAFGAEPGIPELTVLAAWIAEHRGTTADIITYLLDQSLEPQVSAGIMAPCAGGRFYKNRIMQCLLGVDGRKATGEIISILMQSLKMLRALLCRKKVPGVPCLPLMFSGSLIRTMMMNMSGMMPSPARTGP